MWVGMCEVSSARMSGGSTKLGVKHEHLETEGAHRMILSVHPWAYLGRRHCIIADE